MNKSKLEELSKTLSSYEIARALDSSPTNIRYWLSKYGLKTPRHLGSKPGTIKVYNCLNCGNSKTRTRNNRGKYCNIYCKVDYESKEYIRKWEAGLVSGKIETNEVSAYVRNYLLKKHNYACIECGWDKRHPVDNLPRVEIDHIDGDSSNCSPENLRVLCPNCHSMTETYGTRNKQSSRPKRIVSKMVP